MRSLLAGYKTSETPLLIFVTGLPSKTTPQVVLDHFKRYGNVQQYKIGNTVKGNKALQANCASNIKRGFCVLKALNQITYKSILSSSELFLGRSLVIGPFRQGSELWSHNESINSRRVIVKKVPIRIEEESLRQVLEYQFGNISRMYRFAAESIEKAAKKDKSRKNNTYSVEFVNEESAAKASKHGIICISDSASPIILERFQKKVIESVPAIVQTINLKSNSYLTNRATRKPSSNLEELVENMRSISVRCLVSTTKNIQFHCLKPTSRRYFIEREAHSDDDYLNISFNYRVGLNSQPAGTLVDNQNNINFTRGRKLEISSNLLYRHF